MIDELHGACPTLRMIWLMTGQTCVLSISKGPSCIPGAVLEGAGGFEPNMQLYIYLQLMLYRAKRAFLTQEIVTEEQQYPLYPFNVDFLAQKPKKTEWQRIPSPILRHSQSIHTDIEPSEHYSSQEFDSYSSQHVPEESIHEQSILNDPQISAQAQASHYTTHHSLRTQNYDEYNEYDFLSQSALRKMNEKIVILKQEFRRIARKYTHNASILAKQRAELEQLRAQKQKALDYNYELQLSREEARRRVHTHAFGDSIGKVSTIFKKMRYKRVKESTKNDPTDPVCQLSDSRPTENPLGMSRLHSTRQEVLCKMRQQQNNSEMLQALAQKQQDYLRLIDIDNGQLCKGDEESLKKRTAFLRNELKIKEDMVRLKQEEYMLQITALQIEINEVDFKIERRQAQLRDRLFCKQQRREKGSLTKRVLKNHSKKKDSSLVIKICKPMSPRTFEKLQQECTPTTHSKVKISFDHSVITPSRIKQPKSVKSNPYMRYPRQLTTHK